MLKLSELTPHELMDEAEQLLQDAALDLTEARETLSRCAKVLKLDPNPFITH